MKNLFHMKIRDCLTIVLMAVIAPLLGGCGNDEPTPINENAFAKFSFELTLSEAGSDQNDMILTTIDYTTQDGRSLTDTFGKANGTIRTIKSEDFTRAGYTGKVTITEKLLNNVQYGQNTYDLGLQLDFKVTSYGNNNKIINSLSMPYIDRGDVKSENLKRRYPNVTVFSYTVDKSGKVTITKK